MTAHKRTPGDLLIHPVALVALALVLVNDRFLKVHHDGLISGKLSDFAGLVYFPLFLVAFAEGVRWAFGRRPWQLTVRAIYLATAVVGVSFLLIKVWHPAGEVYRSAVGYAYWPFDLVGSVLMGDGVPDTYRVKLVADRWDLVALVVLAVPVWIGHRVMADPPRRRSEEPVA